jgi:hypothetical protein
MIILPPASVGLLLSLLVDPEVEATSSSEMLVETYIQRKWTCFIKSQRGKCQNTFMERLVVEVNNKLTFGMSRVGISETRSST